MIVGKVAMEELTGALNLDANQTVSVGYVGDCRWMPITAADPLPDDLYRALDAISRDN
jgi:hypothetical protein